MDEFQTSFVTGASILGFTTIVSFSLWVYFICKGYKGIENKATIAEIHSTHHQHFHWLRSIWNYSVPFIASFIFLVYYVSCSLGAGLIQTVNGTFILWSRVLVEGLVGLVTHGVLAFILTHHIGDYKTGNEYYHNSSEATIQSVWILGFYFLYVILKFCATLVDDHDVKISLIVFTAISCLLSLLGYFFPFNKLHFFKENEHDDGLNLPVSTHECPHSPPLIKEKSTKHKTTMFFRYSLWFSVVIPTVLYYLIWILSSSNTLFNAIELRSEIFVYTAVDCFRIVALLLMVFFISFSFKQKSVQIKYT